MSGIVLSAAVRQNLLSLQSTAELLSTTQNRLASGKKVNTALDNPINFFTSQGLSNRANDLLVIVVVLVIESVSELAAFPGIFKLTTSQLLVAAPLAFFLFGIGTVLPTMILIYSILLPRYLKLTGSFVVTVLLGGATYALMHLVEGWSTFNGPTNTALSLIFVVLTYQGPGMFKSFVTLRTGNAWVHAIAYHAVPPHVIVDAPLMVKAFAIR